MGAVLNRLRAFLTGDELLNKIFYIHGRPYRFETRLGSGSFGSVYAAQDATGAKVAIKVININAVPSISQRMVETYLNEVALLQRLKQESDHVVLIYDFDFDSQTGFAYIVMELGGENLGKLINRSRASNSLPMLNRNLIRNIWRQMVTIIRTLHLNGIVHMDLKPDNLIFFGSTLKIADLGISRKMNMMGSARVGTPFFSAPEIMQDMVGSRRFYSAKADIWSMGAILYFMVYGRPPPYHPLAANPPLGLPMHPDPLLNDILRRTLVPHPDSRASLDMLIRHPFTNS